MPNVTVYFPDRLYAKYKALAKEMDGDARGISVAAQVGLKREVTRLKALKKAKNEEAE